MLLFFIAFLSLFWIYNKRNHSCSKEKRHISHKEKECKKHDSHKEKECKRTLVECENKRKRKCALVKSKCVSKKETCKTDNESKWSKNIEKALEKAKQKLEQVYELIICFASRGVVSADSLDYINSIRDFNTESIDILPEFYSPYENQEKLTLEAIDKSIAVADLFIKDMNQRYGNICPDSIATTSAQAEKLKRSFSVFIAEEFAYFSYEITKPAFDLIQCDVSRQDMMTNQIQSFLVELTRFESLSQKCYEDVAAVINYWYSLYKTWPFLNFPTNLINTIAAYEKLKALPSNATIYQVLQIAYPFIGQFAIEFQRAFQFYILLPEDLPTLPVPTDVECDPIEGVISSALEVSNGNGTTTTA